MFADLTIDRPRAIALIQERLGNAPTEREQLRRIRIAAAVLLHRDDLAADLIEHTPQLRSAGDVRRLLREAVMSDPVFGLVPSTTKDKDGAPVPMVSRDSIVSILGRAVSDGEKLREIAKLVDFKGIGPSSLDTATRTATESITEGRDHGQCGSGGIFSLIRSKLGARSVMRGRG
jgi:hypothetical protein